MKPDRPNVNPTSRYSVRQTCEMLGIHRHTLANYVKSGFIREGRSLLNGRPFYTGLEILKLFNK